MQICIFCGIVCKKHLALTVPSANLGGYIPGAISKVHDHHHNVNFDERFLTVRMPAF